MACVLHARSRAIFAECMRSVGKQAGDETGKYPVNEDDEEILRGGATGTLSARSEISRVFPRTIHVIASGATCPPKPWRRRKQSIARHNG